MLNLKTKPTPENGALKLKSRKKQSDFERLIEEAIQITAKVNQMSAMKSGRLTAKAMLAETMALAMSSPERIERLHKLIDSDQPGLEDSRASCRRMLTWLQGPNWSAPGKDPRQLQFLSTEATRNELSMRGYSHVELLCVAIQHATKHFPGIFGTCDDTTAHLAETQALRKRQGELLQRIAEEYTSEDIDISEPDLTGRTLVTFKLSNGKVTLGPKRDAGERLVNYLMAQRKE